METKFAHNNIKIKRCITLPIWPIIHPLYTFNTIIEYKIIAIWIVLLFIIDLPYRVKLQYVHSDCIQTTFFFHGRFLKKIADDQCSSITKGSIHNIKHMSILPFTVAVDWPESGCLMGVSIMFHIHTYCVFTLNGRDCKLRLLYIDTVTYILQKITCFWSQIWFLRKK